MTDTQKPVIAEDLRENYEVARLTSSWGDVWVIKIIERTSAAEAERDAAKRGWDSCIADLREAANICSGIEIERDEARKRVAELEQQIARLKAPMTAKEMGRYQISSHADVLLCEFITRLIDRRASAPAGGTGEQK